MHQQQLDDPSAFQSTEAGDSDNDKLSDANPSEQTIQGGSFLEVLEESYIDFNCKLLPEILSPKSEVEDSTNNDKPAKSSILVSNPDSWDNDFTFIM